MIKICCAKCFFHFGASWNPLSQLAVWFLLKSVRIQNLLKGSETFCRMWASELPATGQLKPWSYWNGSNDGESLMWKWWNLVSNSRSWFRGTYASWAADLPNVAANYAVAAAVLELGSHGFSIFQTPLHGNYSRWGTLSWIFLVRSVALLPECLIELKLRDELQTRCPQKMYKIVSRNQFEDKTWRHDVAGVGAVGVDLGRPINEIVSTGTEQKIAWGLLQVSHCIF